MADSACCTACQAAACADAGAALISPFVGRIMDWYKAKEVRGDRLQPNCDLSAWLCPTHAMGWLVNRIVS